MGLTREQLAISAGLSKAQIANLETGRRRSPPSDRVLRRLEGALEYHARELTRLGHLARTPSMLHDECDDNVALASLGALVPIINRVTAGYPHEFTDLDYPPSVADEYIRCPGIADRQAFAARVVGDSMAPDYREGDIVVFSPNTAPGAGDDCFVRFDGAKGTTFKRYYQDNERTVRLEPINPAYPAVTYPVEDITGMWPAVFRVQRLREG
jgi:repressor LexA